MSSHLVTQISEFILGLTIRDRKALILLNKKKPHPITYPGAALFRAPQLHIPHSIPNEDVP
jgi:hypothetical protein